jgi:hypothetical protein
LERGGDTVEQMTDRTFHAPGLFDQDAFDTCEGSSAGLISAPPSNDCPRPLAALGLAIVELTRSSQLLTKMISDVDTSP